VAQEVAEVRGFVEEQIRNGLSAGEIVSDLGQKYPGEPEAIQRALCETLEQVNAGVLVPTPKRFVIEDWDEFVIIHSNLGSLRNRAMAQLLGQALGEKLGQGIVVQHDPYRIFVQTNGTANAERILELLNELKDMPPQTIKDLLTKSTVKTGLFKRRVIHVARRFGALKKWADFSNVSLQKVVTSFEGTPIYDEGLKEVFTKDLDAEGLVHVLGQIRDREIDLRVVETGGNATPVARVGIERVSMKTDLIPPERMRAVLVESAKARLLNETGNFICTSCWSYSEMIRIRELPDKPKCPRCGSSSLGLLKVEEDKSLSLVEKKGEKLAKYEEKLREQAEETAELIANYGKTAAIALSARKVDTKEVAAVLQKEPKPSDKLYELILEAERKALSRRFR
jgi:ATP-dependent Lhr-like helicase